MFTHPSSRMLKSATSFLALSLIALQVVVAQFIETGTYVIQDTSSGLYLGIGPVPRTFPSVDVPVRLFPEGHYFVEKWNVKKDDNGAFTISSKQGVPQGYAIVSDYAGNVIVSVRKAPEAWAVQPAGEGNVQIKLPFQDEVFTTNEDKDIPITLQPAQGLDSQKYRFVRVDRQLYHSNRFYNQESC
ncbi:hypothetical protein CPB97_011521 [Podila verticillata]|nr:hypothetical protein CPB97_011521 [Podila verticillata]